MDWSDYRRRSPALGKLVYLNTAGGGPLSRDAAAAGKRYFDEMLEDGDRHWGSWLERTEDARASLAALLNAEPGEIAFMPTASLGMNLIARMVAKPGDHVLAAEGEFPSATLPWLNQGAEMSFLPILADGSVDLGRADAYVGPKTTAFVASHVQYRTGYRYDLGRLRSFRDRHGLRLIVDATQSLGAYPIDVARDGIDALVFSGYKWLNAGYGIAGLYVRRALLESAAPPVVGWRSASQPSEMVYDRLDLARTGPALEAGHPPFAGIFALGASLSLISEIGAERIATRVGGLTALLHDRLEARGHGVASPRRAEARSGITLVPVDEATSLAKRLMERGVFVSSVEDRLRVSLHFYNNEDDIESFLDQLHALGSSA